MLDENLKLHEEYFSMRQVTPKTKGLYYNALLNWETLTNTPIIDIEKNSLKKWFREVKKDKASATIEKYAQILRVYYAHHLETSGLSKRMAKAQSEELFELIPFRDLHKSKKNESKLKDKVVTPEEFQALMSVTDNVKLKSMIAVTYDSGCRKGEIYNLKIKDVSANHDHWTLTVEGKTGTRTVPIVKSIPYLRAWLQQHPDRENPDQWLFTRITKGKLRKMGPNSFNDSLKYLSGRAGLRKIYPHMLRHSRLTRLAEDGLGEFSMKSFAGWTADSRMAAEYVHLSGRGHVNAVLEKEGIKTGNGTISNLTPFIELSRCPNCDKPIDPKWVQCPTCQFILDDNVGLQKHDRITELEAKLERLMQIVEEKEKLS